MSRVRSEHGQFASSPKRWERLLGNKLVAKWASRLAGEGTKGNYMYALDRFLTQTGLTPEQFIALPPKEARDRIWEVVETWLDRGAVGYAQVVVSALRHFYRYHTDQKLEFDSRRGGKHYIAKKRKRVAYEIIPDRKQFYAIVDSCGNWRDKAILFALFQGGMRINALCHLDYGHVADQLSHVPIRLRISSDIDTKLRGMDIDYYYTFLGSEAVDALNRYIKAMKERGVRFEKNTPLFITSTGKRIHRIAVWKIVKRAASDAGLDPKGIWIHCLRKAFRKVLNASPMDEDTKEAIMGHKLPGVRGNYFDLHDIDEIEGKYMKCNFSRSDLQPVSQLDLLRQFAKTIGIAPDKVAIHTRITTVEDEIAFYEKMIRGRLGIKLEPGELEKPEEREQLGPIYESTVIKEKNLPAYLKKGLEFAGTLNKEKVVIKRKRGKPKRKAARS